MDYTVSARGFASVFWPMEKRAMKLKDDITIEVKGIQTIATVRRALVNVLPKGNWYIDWVTWKNEMEKRITVLSTEPLQRRFILPVVMEVKGE